MNSGNNIEIEKKDNTWLMAGKIALLSVLFCSSLVSFIYLSRQLCRSTNKTPAPKVEATKEITPKDRVPKGNRGIIALKPSSTR